MSNNGNGKSYAPSFQVARLFRKTSASGNTYFTGRWGGARVSLLKSKDTADDGSEIWSLMIAEAPPKQAATGDNAQRDYQRPIEKAAANQGSTVGGMSNDQIPFAAERRG